MKEAVKPLMLIGSAMLLLAGSALAEPANAAEIDFGSATATPAFNATIVDGIAEDGAAVENWGAVITTEVGGLDLTDKLDSLNPVGERGLGVTNVANGCTDATCEALMGQGVLASAGTSKISDAIISSIQAGESFNFFVNGTQVNSSPITNACAATNFTALSDGESCLWTDPTGQGVNSIEAMDVAGSITLAATSSPTVAVPAPTLSGFGVVIAGLLAAGWYRLRNGAWPRLGDFA